MAKSTPQRMSEYRARQRAAGVVSLHLIVPESDVASFQQWATERRREHVAAIGGKPHTSLKVPPSIPASHGRAQGRKSRAESVADNILKIIVKMGWPVGTPLGSEAQLMKAHRCSRTVLRQATRLLEHHAVGRMRRGASGGLVVAEPNLEAIARAGRIYLQYQRIRPVEILKIRILLETEAVARAIDKLTKSGAARLAADIAREASVDGSADAASLQRLHFTIAELSGDPALRLLADIVLSLSDPHSKFSNFSPRQRDNVVRRLKKYHALIVNSIVARDAPAACALMKRYLEGYMKWAD